MKKYLYKVFNAKRYVEQLLMFPCVLFGRVFALFVPLKKQYDLIFFCPTYGIGGAERVNAEILDAVKDRRVLIVFTKKSLNQGMKDFLIRPEFDFVEIDKWTDNKKIYFMNFVYRGIYSQYIKQQKNTQIFIAQCNFGYKILPHIPKGVKVSELIHMHDEKFLWVWAPFIQFINTRVIVGEVFRKKFTTVYEANGIPLKYTNRLKVIRYCLEYIPKDLIQKDFSAPLKFYYAGRGGPQKRLWILQEVIKKCRKRQLPIKFKLAGSFEDEMPQHLIEDGTYVGELKGGEVMYNFHRENDILIMTSAFEGFPIVIMEAIAHGSVIVAPAIDAIPENIEDRFSGFLIHEVSDEDKMVEEIMHLLQEICDKKYDLNQIAKNSFHMLQEKFSKETFTKQYLEVFDFN